jgi:hypothetical protein
MKPSQFFLAATLLLACGTRHDVGTSVPTPERDGGLAPGTGGSRAPAGTGGATQGSVPADAADADASLVSDAAPATGGACPPGQATPAEIAATPRADGNLEMLALWIGKKLTAPQAYYDRIVRDVGAIRAKAPELARVQFTPLYSGTSLMLQVTAAALQEMRNKTYQPWVCANRLYGAREDKFNLSGFGDLVVLEFKGRYNEDLLAEEYGRMPGVRAAQRNTLGGIGGPWQTICATPEGDTWHYVFAAPQGASGVSGTYHHFSTAADGSVTALGSHALAGGAAPLPDWVTKYVSKDACVVPGT